MSDPNWWARGAPVGRPVLQLTEEEQRWVKLKWNQIRTAQRTADKANSDWRGMNISLDSYLKQKGVTDPLQQAKIKGENLALKDALEAGRWHSGNAQRHIDDLMCFLKMKELGLL